MLSNAEQCANVEQMLSLQCNGPLKTLLDFEASQSGQKQFLELPRAEAQQLKIVFIIVQSLTFCPSMHKR